VTIDIEAGRTSALIADITWRPEARGAEGRTVEGHASVFESPATIGGRFVERVAKGAFRSVLAKSPVVPLVYGHDQDKLLASTRNGSLELSEDHRGLKIRATIVGTSLGDDVLTLIRDGLATRMSYAFSIESDDWDYRAALPVRTITEIGELYDVSVVTTPAFEAAEVALAEARAARSLRDRAADVAGVKRGVTKVRHRSSYGEDSQFSYFRDFSRVQEAQARQDALTSSGVPWADHINAGESRFVAEREGTLEDAKNRLAAEQRDSTTSTGSVGQMLGASTGSTPGFIASAYSLAVRSRAVLASALPQRDIPKGTATVRTMRLATGVGAAVQGTENTAATVVDSTSAIVESPITTIAGQLEASQQLFDWSAPGGELDLVIARDFGLAIGGTLERQLFIGSGTSGEMKGFFATGGTTTVTVTANPPAFANVWGAILEARRQHHVSYGTPAEILVMHPRRMSWIHAGGTLANPLPWNIDRLLESVEVPTTRWTGSTNDAILVMSSADVTLYSNPVQFRLITDYAGAANMTVRLMAHQYAALHVSQPAAVTHIGGTLSAPSF
jgi:HK97 family phage prohead protease